MPNYVKASANTRLVGKQLSLLLRGLVEKNGLSLKKTHIIGFSLGAHIAAFAGADLGNLSRITGILFIKITILNLIKHIFVE